MLDYCAPYDQPFELLRRKYAFAIEELKRGLSFRSMRSKPAERLGEHLLSFYWRGKIGLEEDGLVKAYFRACPVDACQHCLEFVGRSLGRNLDVRDEVSERLEALLDSLIDDAKTNRVDPMSLVTFGWWFDSPRLNEEWKVTRLLEVLRQTSRVDPTDTVLECLISIAERLPLEAAQAVSMIAKGEYEPWDYEYWSTKAFAVLKKAVTSEREDVRSAAADAAERFGLSGRLEFREFAAVES